MDMTFCILSHTHVKGIDLAFHRCRGVLECHTVSVCLDDKRANTEVVEEPVDDEEVGGDPDLAVQTLGEEEQDPQNHPPKKTTNKKVKQVVKKWEK
eukprot:5423967-Amphidinium_carterae.1